jgi:glyoxylase-like metal-dependent hydrolase (beta-lactamase superfamily II)
MDETRKSGKKWRLALAGAGAALALYLLVRRALSVIVAQMEEPQPDLCQGFESEGLRCVNLGMTTIYLLKGQAGYLLIDTGYTKDYAKFINGLARVGVRLDQIKALLLTHGHDDHAGFAARLLEETGARLITHRDALPLLRGEQMTGQGVRSLNGRILVLTALYTLITRRDVRYPPLTLGDDDVILDGDDTRVLRDLGVDATVIHTPGHTAICRDTPR